MNVASLVSNRYTEIENRKKSLKQKSADDAYRKNAQYFKPIFNPALEELVGLLTGKKEQEHQPEVQAAIHDLKQNRETTAQDEGATSIINEKDLITEEHTAASKQQSILISQSEAHDQTMAILEDVRYAALASENPYKQDNQVASIVANNIQGQSSQTSDSSKVIQLNGQEQDETAKQRLFKKAISRYSFHVQMARQGFQFAQPSIYLAV